MKTILEAHDVLAIVQKGYKDSLTQAQRYILMDSIERDKKTLFLTYQALDEDDLEKISNNTDAKERHGRSSSRVCHYLVIGCSC